MSMTVTATESGSAANGILLWVRVITGQNASPIGTIGNSTTAVAKAITPAATGSWVYGAVSDNQTSLTANGSQTTLQATKLDATNVWGGAAFRSTATTTAATPVTLGISGTPAGPGWAAVEIKAGTGLAEDASSPIAASTLVASTIASAAFTPPAGSLIVVMAACEAGFSGATGITITNTGGLTFTQQETGGGGGGNYFAGVWTAVVPSSGPTLGTPGLALSANALVPSAVTGSVPLGVPSLAFTASPLVVSAGIKTTALGIPGLALAANSLVPSILNPFPHSPLAVKVELLIGATWTDISQYVFFAESSDQIVITGGRPDESGFVSPSSLTLQVNNNDGRFSPKNANSPWFGLIGRNTEIRVSVQAKNPSDGTMQYRAWQEVAEWPFTWDPTDSDRRGTLTAAGVLRRLQQSGSLGTAPANIPLPLTAFLAGLSGTSLAPAGWWPCTDQAGSAQFASGVSGGPVMTFQGTPNLAASTDFPGSAALPTFNLSTWTALFSGATLTPGGTSVITDTFGVDPAPWQCPPGVTTLTSARAIGAGGGGAGGTGGGSPNSGGGGGAGGVGLGTGLGVTPGNFYQAVVPPATGENGDGGDASFPTDSGTITGGGGSGASGTDGGDGGSGTFPGGKGGAGEASAGTVSGGGGGGAGGSDGGPAGPFLGDGAGGGGANGGGNGGEGGQGDNLAGQAGQAPGGGGGGGGRGSAAPGAGGAAGKVAIQYTVAGESGVSVTGGPQNASVFRFMLEVPKTGDADGGEIGRLYTSGTAAIAQIFYHPGIAVLTGGLGSGTITALGVEPIPEPITSGTVITVTAQDGTSQQFTCSSTAVSGSSSVSITSATPTITTEAGDVCTNGADLPGYLQLFLLDSSNNRLLDTGLKPFGVHGRPMAVSVDLAQSGANIAWTFQYLLIDAIEPTAFTGTVTAASVGTVGAIIMNPSGELSPTACGQITIQYATNDLLAWASPMDGWQGETAANRFLRLCAQQGIASQVIGDPDDSVMMGVQPSDTFVNLIQDCETADMGLVFEPRTFLGLSYRTRVSMLSQTPVADLNYAAFTLPDDPMLTPDYDDQYTSNDVLVSRTGGSSLEVTLQNGRMSVQPPPLGVGQYASSVEINLADDGQLADIAGWLLWRSTVDEYRFPTVAVRMEYESIANTALFTGVSAVDIGDFIQISKPPSWLVSDNIKQVNYGSSETIKPRSWVLAWNAVPESPYEIAVSDVAAWRSDTTGSTLVTGITSTGTTLSVATTLAGAPLWDTVGADDPFDIVLNGERMTVTAITGTSSPQSFTVTRSVNGVAKAHIAGEAVALFNPPVASI